MARGFCNGFAAGAAAAGLKKQKGMKDLGLICSDAPASVAGVFTRNRVQAAPVRLDRERIAAGVCRAVIVNSGNANCCTGPKGMADAVAMARLAAEGLRVPEEMVLVASTGVIGQPLAIDKVAAAVPDLMKALRPDGLPDVAEAMLTTDTVPKIVSRTGEVDGRSFTVVGVAKGSGMIRPDIATMLCFVCTDADADPQTLQKILSGAVDRSFNRITVDGDTSTNDTVLLMAGGRSGVAVDAPPAAAVFGHVLDEVLMELARMIVRDGEGATKVVEIAVTGAESDAAARAVADVVAHSNLVKTALFGEDANWGRIVAAVGRAGVPVDPDRIAIRFDDVLMVENGVGCGEAAEARAAAVLKKPEFSISVDLNMGAGRASTLTCDFSVEYVRINADYRS
jgi:glutamate N-acetyltransferase/amino-acid N-acetyltransferase